MARSNPKFASAHTTAEVGVALVDTIPPIERNKPTKEKPKPDVKAVPKATPKLRPKVVPDNIKVKTPPVKVKPTIRVIKPKVGLNIKL